MFGHVFLKFWGVFGEVFFVFWEVFGRFLGKLCLSFCLVFLSFA